MALDRDFEQTLPEPPAAGDLCLCGHPLADHHNGRDCYGLVRTSKGGHLCQCDGFMRPDALEALV